MLSIILTIALGQSKLSIDVRPTDLDSKGHINNAKYIEYTQFGRWRWLEEHTASDEVLQAQGTILVVVRTEIDSPSVTMATRSRLKPRS